MIKIIFLPLLFLNITLAQQSEWFPSDINIQPFTANFLEPKAGFHYMLGKSSIRLDIGTSSDIYHLKNSGSLFSIGADLFTYTRLRGESEFHFPVEAIDYLFGINSAIKIEKQNYTYGIRGRISHISAHFVDGKYDFKIKDWRDGDKPRVFSREFIELFPFYEINSFRAYAGLTYIFHTSPSYLGKGIYQLGFDYFLTTLSENLSPFAAYDFKLEKRGAYFGSNILSAGVKFGNYNSKGISIFFSYFSGLSVHGEYFDRKENYGALGVNLDI